jgi:hypothetical protein
MGVASIFWFAKPVHYESRSRINDLKAMTTQVLRQNVPAVLMAKTGLDVVRDVVGQNVVRAEEQLAQLKMFADQNAEESARFIQDISKGRREVKRLANELFEEFRNLENGLLGKLRPLSLENIRDYLEDEIGYTIDGIGFKLNLRIKGALNRSFEQSSKVIYDIAGDDEKLMDFFAPQLKEFEKIVKLLEERSTFINTSQAKLQGMRTKLNALVPLPTTVELR